MMIDVFFQQKTQEFRDQKRSPNRDQECQDAAQSNAEGADCEVRVQRRSNRRDERIRSPKKLSSTFNQNKKAKNSSTRQVRR